MITHVKLTPEMVEWNLMRTEHTQRENLKSNPHFKGQAYYGRDEGTEFGFLAELAFAYMINAPTDELREVRKYVNGKLEWKPDITLRCGLTVDVKATKNLRGGINVPRFQKCRTDIHVLLVELSPAEFKWMGWQWSKEVFKEKWWRDKGADQKPYRYYPGRFLKNPYDFDRWE